MVRISLEGGLGNQLFMQAFIFAYAKKYHVQYCVGTNVINPHVYDKQVYNLSAYRFPGINYCSDPHDLQVVKENGFRYQEFAPMDNVCFSGFFQSAKYFDEYRNELLEAFDLPYKKNKGVVAIHVRRGDYLDYPDHHPVVTKEYLEKAIYFFQQRGYYKFKCFSDGLDWCEENLLDKGVEIEFSKGQTEMQDLIDISCCEHQIGSNSSFSWWGHYLNQNKNKWGVFPKTWFGKLLNHDITDLILPNSIVM